MTLKELREKRAELQARMRAEHERRLTDPDKWTDEDRAAWEKMKAERAQLVELIEVSEEEERQEGALTADAGDQEVGRGDFDGRDDPHDENDRRSRKARRRDAEEAERAETDTAHMLRAFTVGGRGLRNEEREACERRGFDPTESEITLQMSPSDVLRDVLRAGRAVHPTLAADRMRETYERRAMSALLGQSGGFLVPSTLVRELELAMALYGGMLTVSEVIRTATGEEMNWPTSNDTSNKGSQIGESTQDSEGTITIGSTKWRSYDFTSNMIYVPNTLIRDSAVNLPALLGQMLGERLGRILNEKFTTGNGAGTPNGIVTAATLGTTTASATALAADELKNLIHDVDPAYRVMGGRFMMHDGILEQIELLKDSNGRYLLQDNYALGMPSTICGYPYTINQDMASSLTATYKTVLFGALNYYKARLVGNVIFRRLDERRADYRQTVFLALTSADGNLLDAGTHPVKYIQQHA